MVGKLGDLKQVAREPAHKLAGAVVVKKVEAQLLHVCKERLANVGLDADAERVTPQADHIVEQRPQHIRQRHNAHHNEKCRIRLVRQQLVHRLARDERIEKIHRGHGERAEHIQREELPVRFEEG